MKWRCEYGHRHEGTKDRDRICPDYIERVWKPAGGASDAIKELEADAEKAAKMARATMRKKRAKVFAELPDAVLIYLITTGRDLTPEQAELVRRFRRRAKG